MQLVAQLDLLLLLVLLLGLLGPGVGLRGRPEGLGRLEQHLLRLGGLGRGQRQRMLRQKQLLADDVHYCVLGVHNYKLGSHERMLRQKRLLADDVRYCVLGVRNYKLGSHERKLADDMRYCVLGGRNNKMGSHEERREEVLGHLVGLDRGDRGLDGRLVQPLLARSNCHNVLSAPPNKSQPYICTVCANQ